jgi:hypothetical protein
VVLLLPSQLSELRLTVERLSRDKASLLPHDCMAPTPTTLASPLLLLLLLVNSCLSCG